MIAGFDNLSCYELLDISPGVEAKEVQEGYYRVRQIFAKDALASYSLYTEAEREEILHVIEDAYRMLIDEKSREQYDRQLHLERVKNLKAGKALQEGLPLLPREPGEEELAKEAEEALRALEPREEAGAEELEGKAPPQPAAVRDPVRDAEPPPPPTGAGEDKVLDTIEYDALPEEEAASLAASKAQRPVPPPGPETPEKTGAAGSQERRALLRQPPSAPAPAPPTKPQLQEEGEKAGPGEITSPSLPKEAAAPRPAREPGPAKPAPPLQRRSPDQVTTPPPRPARPMPRQPDPDVRAKSPGAFEDTVLDVPAPKSGPSCALNYLDTGVSGKLFRQWREAKGLTLDQVWEATRIRKPILQAIEEEDFNRLPADVFLKGMLKSLAALLEIENAEAAIQGYMQRRTAARDWMD
jgi:hypothetical protein